MVTFGSLLLAAGLALMVYVGYEASICESPLVPRSDRMHGILITLLQLVHHPADREGLRLTQQEFEGLPFRLVLMLGVAAGVSLLGGLQSSGQLKPISVADDPP